MSSRSSAGRAGLLAAGLGLLIAMPACGQFGGLNAEFAGGGARALAMGGAFIALADDATATEFNPAGLWQLRRPELAAQILYTYDERPTGLLQAGDSGLEVVFEDDRDDYIIPSFLSFVYPMQRFTLGISEFTNVFYDRGYPHPITGEPLEERAANYALGLTLATAPFERFSIGGTVRYNFFRFECDGGDDRERFNDEAWTANFGLLWRLHRYIQVGAVYKLPQPLKGQYRGFNVDTELPATLGFGLALLPNDRWRILADVDRISWSDFDPNPEDDFYREDVLRYHLGVEWHAGVWKQTAFFLRAGYLYEESNAYRYRGDNPYFRQLASEDDSIQHLSFGIGMARPRYQLDIGVDLTEDRGQDIIASIVWYF